MKYTDAEGAIWAEGTDHMWQCDREKEHGDNLRRRDVETLYGPLRAVNEHADDDTRRAIRAELAIVFEELADDAHSEYLWREDDDASMCYRTYELFNGKAEALRAEVSG